MSQSRSQCALLFVLAVAGCGGPTSPATPPTTLAAPPPTTAPAPTTLADLSASVTSPQADSPVNCRDDLRARVALNNRGATGVAVTGVLMATGVIAGDCTTGRDFTYSVPRIVFPNTTAAVMDQSLYNGPHACCFGSNQCAGSCRFQKRFEVVTELGRVPAGTFDYTTFFQNCPACSAAATGVDATCPRLE